MAEPFGNSETNRLIRARILQLAAQMILTGAVLFFAAGTLRWPMAWIYLALGVLVLVANGFFLLRYNPGIIAERARLKADTKPWDKLITALYAIATLAMLVVAGLDRRWAWSAPLPGWMLPVAVTLFMLGNGLANWAMAANAYFSTTVRIQDERGHHVCRSGPYRFVRHPGYSGWILSWVSVPMLLDTPWALLASGAAIAILIVRTRLEDQTLHHELPGYADYAQHTRSRLVPGLW